MDVRKRILIVDDEQINLEFFDVMLSKLGFLVEKAEDGLEALEKVKLFKPDLIILDNIMPKMSGWEVTKTLKFDTGFKEYKDVPIIMFSAMDDVKDKVEGFELGVDDYITKPYNFSEVLARIKAVLRNYELFNQIAARETRVELAENLNGELQEFIRSITVSLKSITANTTAPTDQTAALQQVRTGLESLLPQLTHMDEKISLISKNREAMKNREIELPALQRQYRKAL